MFHFADPAILGTFWDSGPIEHPLIAHWKWIEYDLTSTTIATFRVYVETVLRQTITLPTTSGQRDRDRLILAPHWWGRLWRVTMDAPANVELYGLTAWSKTRGDAVSYRPQPLMRLAG